MTQPADPKGEFRANRHEFILQYYDMAVRDLERHLGIGWQTVAIAVGALASLGAASEGILPVPVAVAVAFIVCFWGILNILDADYWALRAIAFLANVEAIYFYEGDQSVFNPYAGKHPPFKMLDSLRAQLIAVFSLLGISIAFFAWHIARRTEDLEALGGKLAATGYVTAGFWAMPVVLFIVLANLAIDARKKRVKEYLQFVTSCPGPGMVKDRAKHRMVDLTGDAQAGDITQGADIQKAVREELQKAEEYWDRWCSIVLYVSVVACAVIILAIVFKSYIWV